MLSLLRQFVAFIYSRFRLGPLEPYARWLLTGRRPVKRLAGHVREGFVFLLNQERVLLEVMELTRLKIAGALKIAPEDVTCSFDVVKGKPRPTFAVKNPPPGIEPELVRETMATIYAHMKLELAQRFAGLEERRD